jgi:trimeric autotransporter adhesin
MRKNSGNFLLATVFALFALSACQTNSKEKKEATFESEEHEAYDGPAERAAWEFMRKHDPLTNTLPVERLWDAITYGRQQQVSNQYRTFALAWQERGPIYDSVGPSNGNGRGGFGTNAYCSGRLNGFLIDAGDVTGNTVLTGGANGGIWRCTNFLSSSTPPNWQPVNDYMANMSVVSFCQHPSNPLIMYASTGEPWGNADAVNGNGVFKSIDGGTTWNHLPSTAGITRSFKILCDAFGNVYYATRSNGLLRSNDGGNTWTTITPTSTSSACSDIEITGSGRLHASLGFGSSAIYHRYTESPSSVTSSTWQSSTGLRVSGTQARRFEMAIAGNDIVYGITTNSSNNIDSSYKSIDGGATWAKMNTTAYTSSITNTQGWYDLTLAVNPDNTDEIIMGGLDAYKSTNSGANVSRLTYWVSTAPYVHADHHFMQWRSGGRILIASDGGLFYSTNGGTSFVDKNQNMAVKQFYSCAIHPTAQSNYILGGAQDNGSHQFKNPGLSYTTEVTGGDGAYVAIDQTEPQYQFTSYVYNTFRRSTNNGTNWSSFNFYLQSSPGVYSNFGAFINAYEFDDVANVIFSQDNNNQLFRWSNPQTAFDTASAIKTHLTITELNGSAGAITISPYTNGRMYLGSSSGRIIRVNNSATTTGTGSGDVTLLATPVSGGYVNNIAVGTNDNNLLAVYSNYGVNNVWYSSDGGLTWTAIDGNLPDMPVNWAVFHPTNNNKIVIGTEAGIYTTGAINGASTQWAVSPGFPLVRVDMIKLRKNDNTIVAATHGRGMWSGNILEILPLKDITLTGTIEGENKAALSWKTIDASNKVKYHVQYSTDGINFNEIALVPYNVNTFKHTLSATTGYYRIMGAEPNSGPIFSNVIAVKSAKPAKGLQVKITPNPIGSTGNIIISSSTNGNYTWQLCNVQGSILKTGNGSLQAGASINQPIDVNKLSTGMYMIRVIQGKEKITSSFIKQ